MNSEIRCSFW